MDEMVGRLGGDVNNLNICNCCGAKIVQYKHSLSTGLLQCLYSIAVEGRGIHELKNLSLSYSQRSNFSKLKYWKLVEKIGDPNGKGGQWRVTEKGYDFLSGKIKLFKSVRTFRDEVVCFEGAIIGIQDIKDGWMYRPEYGLNAIACNI